MTEPNLREIMTPVTFHFAKIKKSMCSCLCFMHQQVKSGFSEVKIQFRNKLNNPFKIEKSPSRYHLLNFFCSLRQYLIVVQFLPSLGDSFCLKGWAESILPGVRLLIVSSAGRISKSGAAGSFSCETDYVTS